MRTKITVISNSENRVRRVPATACRRIREFLTLAGAVAFMIGASGCKTCFWCGHKHEDDKRDNSGEAPPAPAPVSIKGKVTYLERIAMHPAAIVEVRLWDLTAQPGKPQLVEELRIKRPGEVPVEFELVVPAEKVDESHEYSLSARIVVQDAVLFASDTEYKVLQKDAPDSVAITLARAKDQ